MVTSRRDADHVSQSDGNGSLAKSGVAPGHDSSVVAQGQIMPNSGGHAHDVHRGTRNLRAWINQHIWPWLDVAVGVKSQIMKVTGGNRNRIGRSARRKRLVEITPHGDLRSANDPR